MKITMKFDRETKGTNVFKDDSEDAIIPTLYIKKKAFDGKDPPKSITVEIKELK